MATVLKLGPADHGRPMTLEEYLGGDYEEGYQYELIDGELYVSPMPDSPYDDLEKWLLFKLYEYTRQRPDIIDHVTDKARVFVPGRRRTTCPEPDLAAYHEYPKEPPPRQRGWQYSSPILVGEVMSADDPDKDLVRNVDLYLQVPEIREYWIVDPREDVNRPRLLVYRRRGERWQRLITVQPGETYTTRLLPGFELVVDPRR